LFDYGKKKVGYNKIQIRKALKGILYGNNFSNVLGAVQILCYQFFQFLDPHVIKMH
jgi:hypothetical protein